MSDGSVLNTNWTINLRSVTLQIFTAFYFYGCESRLFAFTGLNGSFRMKTNYGKTSVTLGARCGVHMCLTFCLLCL